MADNVEMRRSASTLGRQILNKVPEVTIYF